MNHDSEIRRLADALAEVRKMLMDVWPPRLASAAEAATATSRTQVLITSSARISSFNAWTYTGKVLELVDGGSRENTYAEVGDPVTLYNRAELASIGGFAAAVLDGTHHQLGFKNADIVGTCKVLPFRAGYPADCDEIDGIYYFTAENTVGAE